MQQVLLTRTTTKTIPTRTCHRKMTTSRCCTWTSQQVRNVNSNTSFLWSFVAQRFLAEEIFSRVQVSTKLLLWLSLGIWWLKESQKFPRSPHTLLWLWTMFICRWRISETLSCAWIKVQGEKFSEHLSLAVIFTSRSRLKKCSFYLRRKITSVHQFDYDGVFSRLLEKG